MALGLAEKLLRIHEGLERSGVEHAFGGAIALAYWTEDPRGTSDIDVNLFTSNREPRAALDALPDGVAYDERSIDAIERDGQIRLFWEDTPIDLFFSNLPIHDEAERHRRQVQFQDVEIPILGPLELALFKVMFDRTRDWADIEAMLEAGSLDVDALRELIASLTGGEDPRFARLDDAVRRAGAQRA
jgi:hypothetical protein